MDGMVQAPLEYARSGLAGTPDRSGPLRTTTRTVAGGDARVGIRQAVTTGTEPPVPGRTERPVTLGTDPHAGTTGSDGWYH
jgi:hypothetical protein